MQNAVAAAITVVLLLAACARAPEAPVAPAAPVAPKARAASAGPLDYAAIVADPAGAIGQAAQFKLGLVAGDKGLVSGEKVTPTEQSWRDPAGKEFSLGPPPGFAVGPTCIFVVVDQDRLPIVPLQPVVVDKMQPCELESSFGSVTTAGTVADVREVQLLFNGEAVTLKAPVLTKIDFITPKL